eukprot:scaffold655_cov379-Prasinococcus_capsulatus_cf.AAC.2
MTPDVYVHKRQTEASHLLFRAATVVWLSIAMDPSRVALCFVAATYVFVLAGAEDCAPGVPDCDHVSDAIPEVVAALNSSVAETNGPDGMYSFAPMDSGDVGFVSYTDALSMVQFTRHTNPYPCGLYGMCVYNDTIDITVTTPASHEHSHLLVHDGREVRQGWIGNQIGSQGRTDVKFFSISDIGGAYGDGGQNYKNILMLIREMSAKLGLVSSASPNVPPFKIELGCGSAM